MQKGDYTAAKQALLQVYGKYSLVPNFSEISMGTLQIGGSQINGTGHEFNSESVFEVAFFDKGDNNFNWGYTGEGSTAV